MVCVSSVVITGCSNSVLNHIDTLKTVFLPGDGISLTKTELAERNSDALYARFADKPSAVLALAYIEHGQFKWISADGAMLVLENGRLVKTTGFSNNLVYLSDTSKDPLKQNMSQIKPDQHWVGRSDWSGGYESGYAIQYEIIDTKVTALELLDHQFQTKLVSERAIFPDGYTATNYYWYDLKSGYLLKSKQTLAPFWPELELVHISSAGRLLGISNKGNRK